MTRFAQIQHDLGISRKAGEAGPPVLYRHHACGEISHVELRATDIDLLPGPGSST